MPKNKVIAPKKPKMSLSSVLSQGWGMHIVNTGKRRGKLRRCMIGQEKGVKTMENLGAGDVPRMVEYLPSMQKALGSITNTISDCDDPYL